MCTVTISPKRGLLGPSEERQLTFEFTAHTQVSRAVWEPLVAGKVPCPTAGTDASREGYQIPLPFLMSGQEI